jgi:feruloyl esterase
MVAAARYPGEFDGYLAGAPGYQLPKAALANLWGSQQWAKLATQGATTQFNGRTLPDLATALTDAERAMVGRSILAQCDALDGVRDGLVQDVQACQQAFNVNTHVPTCSGARDGTCLTAAQKTTLATTHAGAVTSNGTPIYNRFWFDPGIAGSGWKTWKFVNSIALDPLAVGTVFRAPPAFIRDSLAVSVDELAAQITATGGAFSESGIQFMTPPNATDLTAIQQRGAKVLLFHGVSDPIFSAADSADWYEGVVARHGPNAAGFARLFLVPGMNHCSDSTGELGRAWRRPRCGAGNGTRHRQRRWGQRRTAHPLVARAYAAALRLSKSRALRWPRRPGSCCELYLPLTDDTPPA